jgi:hypothetical protein
VPAAASARPRGQRKVADVEFDAELLERIGVDQRQQRATTLSLLLPQAGHHEAAWFVRQHRSGGKHG